MSMVQLSSVRAGVCSGPGPCDPEPLGEGKNWVTERGGLPKYVRAIAHALQRTKGMSETDAITTAIAAVKHWASGGGKVSDATRARAAAAVAHWEAMKGSKGGRSVDQDNAAYREGVHDRQTGKAKLDAARFRQAHPGADADDYPLYVAGFNADRDDLNVELSTQRQRALEVLAELDVALNLRDAMGGVAEWGPTGPPGLDTSGSGNLLPVAPPRRPKPRQAQLAAGDDIPRHRFRGNDLTACTECGRPVSAAVHKRPKA